MTETVTSSSDSTLAAPAVISNETLAKLEKALELIGVLPMERPSAEAVAEAKALVTAAIVAETGADEYSDELLATLAPRSKAHLCLAQWMANVHASARDLEALAPVLEKIADGLLAGLLKAETDPRLAADKVWIATAFTLVRARLVRCHCLRFKEGGASTAYQVAQDTLEVVREMDFLRDIQEGMDAQGALLLRYTEAMQLSISINYLMGAEIDADIYAYAAERIDNYARLMCFLPIGVALSPPKYEEAEEGTEDGLPRVLAEVYPRPPHSFVAMHAEVWKNAGIAFEFLRDHVERTHDVISEELANELETEVSVDGVVGLFHEAISCAGDEPDNDDCLTTAAVAWCKIAEVLANNKRDQEARQARAELAALIAAGKVDAEHIPMACVEVIKLAMREYRKSKNAGAGCCIVM